MIAPRSTTDPSHPYDPMCERFAADMADYDSFLEDGFRDPSGLSIQAAREQYVKDEEGTLNRVNGHFLCDGCYIKAGTPSSPEGWKCP